jgi:hypothetical protein
MPEAMIRMAEVAHSESIPVSWNLDYKTAMDEKDILSRHHSQFGDQIIMQKGNESYNDWRRDFPWAMLNMVCDPRPGAEKFQEYACNGIEGIWGYCDGQIGNDGITHKGVPWGLFYLNEKTTFTPSNDTSEIVGAPWTIRDLHKCYHIGQSINYCIDPIEQIRSGTLDKGENITFFQDLVDELIRNLPWNERLYCCIHEEADGPYIFPGKEVSNEGATRVDSEQMKQTGAAITTLPQAVSEFKKSNKAKTPPSVILTSDKHPGSICSYVPPIPTGTKFGSVGPSGNYPDTLFYYDNECQLVFVHPEIVPRTIINYKAEHSFNSQNYPYPEEPVKPCLYDVVRERHGIYRTHHFTVQSWYSIPCGLCEWSDFRNWEVEETNADFARIIDDRVLLIKLNFRLNGKTSMEINRETHYGTDIWVRLRNKSCVKKNQAI